VSALSDHPIHHAAKCPFLGREAWINYAGRFDPCCAPDEERKSLGSFGYVVSNSTNTNNNTNNDDGNGGGKNGESSMLKIWNSEEYKLLCKNYLQKPLCRGCNMRQPPALANE
jgi:hypothetical protein